MSKSKAHFHFVINPKSGIKKKVSIVDLIKADLSADIKYDISFTERAEHATEIAKDAVKDHVDAVIAVGGDGSVNEVSRALIGTQVALGVIPSGSGNGFARHLKIPLQEKAAIQRLNLFNRQRIDTALINDIPFLVTAGVGFDAHVSDKFANFGKRGFLSYAQIATQEFINYKALNYELIIDGIPLETEAFLICFANAGQYGNNAWIAPSASLVDGKLNIGILKNFPGHLSPDIIYKLFNKQIEASSYYQLIHAKEIQLKGAKVFHLDGEPKECNGDLHIKIVPDSLSVIY